VVGQLATSLTGLLAILALGWIAWKAYRQPHNRILSVTCVMLLLVSLLGLIIRLPAGWRCPSVAAGHSHPGIAPAGLDAPVEH